MAVVKVKNWNGMEFHDLLVSASPVTTEVAVTQHDKIVVETPLTLQVHKNAYAYEPELLLSSWTSDFPVVQPRGVGDSSYWRTEQILCKVSDFQKVREWRDFFFDAANTLDCILKGIIEV